MSSLYRHFDGEGNLLYIGISLSALSRLGQHQSNAEWFNRIARQEIEHFSDRLSALEAERKAIENEKPLFNKAMNVEFLEKQKRESQQRLKFYELGRAKGQLRRCRTQIANLILREGLVASPKMLQFIEQYKAALDRVETHYAKNWRTKR